MLLTHRTITLDKPAGSRIYLGLTFGPHRDTVLCDSVDEVSSPLYGKIFAGDVITACSNVDMGKGFSTLSLTAPHLPARVAREATRASSLTLVVSTPLPNVVPVFFAKESFDELVLELDKATGLAIVKRTSTPAMAFDEEAEATKFLEPGDIIVSVTVQGTMFHTANTKAVLAKLKEADAAQIEVRVSRGTASLSSLADGYIEALTKYKHSNGRASPTSMSTEDHEGSSEDGSSDAVVYGAAVTPRSVSLVERPNNPVQLAFA